jgi:hypothetical protein
MDPKELLDGLLGIEENDEVIDPNAPEIEPDIREAGNGALEVDFSGKPEPLLDTEFGANLAETLKSSELSRLADDIENWVEADERARDPWKRRFERGLKACGLILDPDDESKAPFPGAASVTHPLLLEACVQFQARSIAELFPATGPVKGDALGASNEALEEQAERVADFMNYQILYEDLTYFEDTDQMLMLLPLAGSAFKKSFYDPAWKTVRSVLCKAEHVLIPYACNSLHDTPRITHVIPKSHQDLLDLQDSGYYTNVPIQPPTEQPTRVSITDKLDDRQLSIADGDEEHILYEVHCSRKLPGDETALPYIITMEKDSRNILGIRRNWREDDEDKRKRLWFTHYKYLPGLGAYGFGLIHAIGGLGEAATGIIRAVLDAAAFASMQGGFKSRDAKFKGNVQITPGVYHDTDMTFEELSKAFYTPPFKEPSKALVDMLGGLVEAGQRFSSTTESMVGEANNNGPVGTTLALIEQGSKVFSAIHKRLHNSAGEEFRQRFELNSDHLPDQYPYAVSKESRRIARADFSDRISVKPVSDPNVWSQSQRIALAQGVLQLAESAPNLYDSFEAHRMMLEALRVPDIDILLPDPNNVPHSDPVSEGSYLLIGKPVKAHIDEDHQSHITVHQQQMQQFQAMPPEIANRVMPALVAHMAEHYAHAYRLQMSQMIGAPLPVLDTSPQRSDMGAQLDNEIAVAAAQAIQQQIAAQQQAMAMQQQAEAQQQQVAAQQGMQDQQAQADQQSQIAMQQAQVQNQIKDQQLAADIQRGNLKDAANFLRKAGATDIPPAMLVDTSQALGKNFAETLAEIKADEMAGQGGSPYPYTETAIQ